MNEAEKVKKIIRVKGGPLINPAEAELLAIERELVHTTLVMDLVDEGLISSDNIKNHGLLFQLNIGKA